MFCGAPPLTPEECPRFVKAPLSKKCKLCGTKEKNHGVVETKRTDSTTGTQQFVHAEPVAKKYAPSSLPANSNTIEEEKENKSSFVTHSREEVLLFTGCESKSGDPDAEPNVGTETVVRGAVLDLDELPGPPQVRVPRAIEAPHIPRPMPNSPTSTSQPQPAPRGAKISPTHESTDGKLRSPVYAVYDTSDSDDDISSDLDHVDDNRRGSSDSFHSSEPNETPLLLGDEPPRREFRPRSGSMQEVSRKVLPLGSKPESATTAASLTTATTFAVAAIGDEKSITDATSRQHHRVTVKPAPAHGDHGHHSPSNTEEEEPFQSNRTIQLHEIAACREDALAEWNGHIAEILAPDGGRPKGRVFVLGHSQVRLMSKICESMGLELREEYDPQEDSLDCGDFVLPIKSKDIAKVIRKSPASGVYIGRFPNTRKMCGKALMTKLMRRAHTYAPVLKQKNKRLPVGGEETPTKSRVGVVASSHSRDPSMARLKETFLSFLPRTWIVPADAGVLANEMGLYSKQIRRYTRRAVTFIVKPDGGARGDGIFLANSYQDIEYKRDWMWRKMPSAAKEYVVQHYIDNPLLLELSSDGADESTPSPPKRVTRGVKFDLRLYIVVVRLSPSPVVYLCKEGLARLCTTLYEAPVEGNMQDSSIHLSNYSLNKKEASFRRDIYDRSGGLGNKRALSAVLPLLEKQGLDVSTLWEKLALIAYRTVVALAPSLSRSATEGGPDYRGCSTGKCFHVLGMDVMLDQDFHPWLLELNSSPSMNTATAVQVDECDDEDIQSNCRRCNCSEVPGTHYHVTSAIDDYVKRTVMQGAMEIALALSNGVPVHRYLQLLHCCNTRLASHDVTWVDERPPSSSRYARRYPLDHLLFDEPIEAWVTASAPTGGARRLGEARPTPRTGVRRSRSRSYSRPATPDREFTEPAGRHRRNDDVNHRRSLSAIVNQDDSDDSSVDDADALDTDAPSSDDDDDSQSDQDFVVSRRSASASNVDANAAGPHDDASTNTRERNAHDPRSRQILPTTRSRSRTRSDPTTASRRRQKRAPKHALVYDGSILDTLESELILREAGPLGIDFGFDRSAYRTIYVLQGMRKLWRAVAGKARQINSFKIRGMCRDGELTNTNLTLGEVDGIFRRVRRDGYSKGHKTPGMREFFDIVTLLVAQSVHGVLQPQNMSKKTKASGAAGSGSAVMSNRAVRTGPTYKSVGVHSAKNEYPSRVVHGLEIPLDGSICSGIEKLIKNYFIAGLPNSPRT